MGLVTFRPRSRSPVIRSVTRVASRSSPPRRRGGAWSRRCRCRARRRRCARRSAPRRSSARPGPGRPADGTSVPRARVSVAATNRRDTADLLVAAAASSTACPAGSSLARTLPGSRDLERAIKDAQAVPRYCPDCAPAPRQSPPDVTPRRQRLAGRAAAPADPASAGPASPAVLAVALLADHDPLAHHIASAGHRVADDFEYEQGPALTTLLGSGT